ncbi:unnamed protein product [Rotaria sordida]|uniref:Uncharacterized protein n=1 Tax=Rotaria sordida TaxID=392033 RepID=A0A815I118_9BILA|nr:unnamed protein product [Rotaria sordida]CAF3943112.1 unnamed protein product [Rotaria sordida]
MLRKSKGPMIQVDRLIFDTRNKTKPNSIITAISHSLPILNLPSNLSVKKNNEYISGESYVSFPANKLKVIRLTLDDINNEKIVFNENEKKIYSINQQSSSSSSSPSSSSSILEDNLKKKNENIFSPVYESIDEKRDIINHNKKQTNIYDDPFEIL